MAPNPRLNRLEVLVRQLQGLTTGGGGGTGAISAISASNHLFTSGTVRITGGPNVTVGSDASGVSISGAAAPAQSVQTQGLVAAISNSQVSRSGVVNVSGAGAVVVGSETGNAFTISAPVQTVQTQGLVGAISNSQASRSGTVNVSGAGIVQVGTQTGNAFTISASQSVQTQGLGVAAISNSQASMSATVNLSGSNIVTVKSTTGNAFVIDASAAQTVQTQGLVRAVSASDKTIDGTAQIIGTGNAVTIGTQIGDANPVAVVVSVQSVQSVQTQSLVNAISNSQVSMSGAVKLSGSNIITVKSTTGNAFVIDASAAQTVQTQGIRSISASDHFWTSGGVMFTGAGIVTVSAASDGVPPANTVTISAVQTDQTQNVHNVSISANASTSGTLAHISSGTLSLVAGPNITLSQNANTVAISAAAGGAPPSLPIWQNMERGAYTALPHLSAWSKSPLYWNEVIPGKVTLKSVAAKVYVNSTGTLQSFSVHFGVYALVNSTSMSLVGSASDAFVLSTGSSASWSNHRDVVLTSPGTHTGISTLSAGQYVFGLMFSAAATASMNMSLYGQGGGSAAGLVYGQFMPGTNSYLTGAAQGVNPFNGLGTATVNALAANVVAADISNQGTQASSQLMQPFILIRS